MSFNLRILFCAVAIAAMAFAWLATQQRAVREETAAIQRLEDCGWFILTENRTPVWISAALGDMDYWRVVERLNIGTSQGNGPVELAEWIACLREIRSVELNGSEFDEKVYCDLLRRSTLSCMDLSDSAIRDTAFQSLGCATSLTELRLSRTRVTDGIAPMLAGLAMLDTLHLDDTSIRDKGIGSLRSLERLTWLKLDGCQITDRGLMRLPFQRLEILQCSRTDVSDSVASAVQRMPALKHIDVSHTRITDDFAMRLCKNVALRQVYLSHTRVTDAGVSNLAQMTTIEQIGLAGCRVTDKGICELAGLPRLQFVDLHDTRITGAGLALLRRKSGITVIHSLEE